MKENVRNISKKLEEEKQENMTLNSVNSRKTSLLICNWSKIIKYLHHYDDFYKYYDDLYEYYDDFFFLIEHLHHQKNFIFIFLIKYFYFYFFY